MSRPQWTATNMQGARPVGRPGCNLVEFKDIKGEHHYFEILMVPPANHGKTRIVFGGSTNCAFLESGYIEIEDHEYTKSRLPSNQDEELECLQFDPDVSLMVTDYFH